MTFGRLFDPYADDLLPDAPNELSEQPALRIATWNVNSIRARGRRLNSFLIRVRPHVLCVQETKIPNLDSDTLDLLDSHGYDVAHIGEKSYNGVAIASRIGLGDTQRAGEFDNPTLDAEARTIAATVETAYGPIRICSVYIPHGRSLEDDHYQYKLTYLAQLEALARTWQEHTPVILAGDFNVALTDEDCYNPGAWKGKTHLSPPERTSYQQLINSGYLDTDRQLHPAGARYTWWGHRNPVEANHGLRIDAILLDTRLGDHLAASCVDRAERSAVEPSDHAPVICDLV